MSSLQLLQYKLYKIVKLSKDNFILVVVVRLPTVYEQKLKYWIVSKKNIN
jgi:hypothetical protein